MKTPEESWIKVQSTSELGPSVVIRVGGVFVCMLVRGPVQTGLWCLGCKQTRGNSWKIIPALKGVQWACCVCMIKNISGGGIERLDAGNDEEAERAEGARMAEGEAIDRVARKLGIK